MMSELLTKRLIFTRGLCELITWGNEQPGCAVAWGRDFDEDNEPLRHKKGSLHYLGLANDLALYIGGVYQDKTEAYAFLARKWKSMNPEFCWGGDFKSADGNHFSMTYQGRK